MDQQKIGTFLKTLRNEKGLTQEELAEILNVSSRSISRWENGKNFPDISLLIQLADLYDFEILEIIDGERKSETMKEETREVAEKLSDYAEADKELTIKRIRNQSLMGVVALAVYFILDVLEIPTKYPLFESISRYCLTLIFVSVLLIPILTTGFTGMFKRRSDKKISSLLEKPLSGIIAFISACFIVLLVTYIKGMLA